MEKVIRVCEMTGRMTVVAERVTPETAIEMIRKLAPVDNYGTYARIKINERNELKKNYIKNYLVKG